MANTISKIEDKSSIPNLPYEGYLWFSDSPEPIIIGSKGKKFEPNMLKDLPFVVEGMLYNKEEKVSIRIVNLDGEYRIARVDLPDMKKDRKKEYFSKKHFGEDQRICMYEHWEEKADPINNDRLVLQPAWSAFIGFKNRKDV